MYIVTTTVFLGLHDYVYTYEYSYTCEVVTINVCASVFTSPMKPVFSLSSLLRKHIGEHILSKVKIKYNPFMHIVPHVDLISQIGQSLMEVRLK